MKKKLIIIIAIIVVLAAICAGLLYTYSTSEDYRSNRFGHNYIINGVDCSNLTLEEAEDIISDEYNKKNLVVTDGDNKIASYTDFGCTFSLKENPREIKRDNFLMAALNHYVHNEISLTVPMKASESENSFKDEVESADFLKQSEDTVETQNAYVDTSDESFPIVPEVYGNRIDTDKFYEAVLEHIANSEFTLKYNESDYYADPEISSKDETLLKYQDFCKNKLTQKITYEMGKKTFTIPVTDLADLYAKDGSGAPDKDGIKAYVKELASEYDNVGKKRTIKTFAGKKVTISGGTYGWRIDQPKECKQLASDIESGKDVSREPVYNNTGYTKYQDGIGDTYIDVDFTKQTVHLYINGKDKFHCEVVTGCKAEGKSTPEGTWYVKNKIRNVTMRGTNSDGSKYEVPANYWMGVTPNGIGFHDSNWRTEFGGDIWKTNGSHGCINMPKWLVDKMYNKVEVNMPVIMHY